MMKYVLEDIFLKLLIININSSQASDVVVLNKIRDCLVRFKVEKEKCGIKIPVIAAVSYKNIVTYVKLGDQYCVSDINIDGVESILIAYQNRDIFQEKAAQVIFGSISSKGRLPVSIHKDIPVNTKIESE